MEKQNSIFSLDDRKIYIFLALACLLVYANSLSGDFVFDDTAQIVGNTKIRSWQNIINAFTTDVWAFERGTGSNNIPPPYYRPIFTLYLTVGYQLFGLWQQGWHLLNLAIHIGATILSYRLFLRLSKDNKRLSSIAAVLFALIPVHVESISWISGIPDPLAALFYIPAMLFYIDWREKGNKKFLIFSLISYFLAILCKETPIVLPVVLLVWELTLNCQNETLSSLFSRIKYVVIFALPVIVYLAMRVSVLGKVSWKHPFITQTPTEFIYATIPYVVVYYLKNIFFPFNLSLIYDTHFVKGFDDVNFWIPLVILLIIGGLIYFFRKKITPLMWLGMTLFIIPLLPVLNLQVFHYEYIVQDRYLYLPSIGFVLLIGYVIETLWHSEKKTFQQVAMGMTVILCIAYAGGTLWQNQMWHSAINLWTRAIEMKPGSWASYYNLGLAHAQNKEYEKAVDDLNNSLKYQSFNRQDSLIYNNRGLAFRELGKKEEAKKDFIQALEIDPKSIEALTNLGVAYFDQGNYVEAENQFKKGLQINSSNPFVNYNLARTWGKTGRHKEALGIYEKLLQNDQIDPELFYDAAVSYAAIGNSEKARTLLNDANRFTKDEKLKQQISDELQKLK